MSDSGATDRDALREAAYVRIRQARNDNHMDCRGMVPFRACMMPAVEDVLAMARKAERERIAAKIEAIEHRVAQPGHTYRGVARPPARDIEAYRADVLRVVHSDE